MAHSLDWNSVSDIGGNILDSRDIEELIEELESELEDSKPDPDADPGTPTPEPMDEDRAALLKCLQTMRDDVGSSEWPHGLTLIHDSYFEEYAQELAEDIGAVKHDAEWPYTCIDWKQAARELQYDYSRVDVDGQAYWYLSH